MDVKAIRNEADYRVMLAEVSDLIDLDPEPDSPEGERLTVLSTLAEAWEAEHYRVDAPDPVEALKFHMDRTGMTVADLVPYIGPRHRVYEVLAGSRSLTMPMIRRLLTLGIPASSLVGKPQPVDAIEVS